jgi:hypothetical protein
MEGRKYIATSDNTNALSEYVYFDFCSTCDITTIRNIPKFSFRFKQSWFRQIFQRTYIYLYLNKYIKDTP